MTRNLIAGIVTILAVINSTCSSADSSGNPGGISRAVEAEPLNASSMTEHQTALELGRKVLAVREAIQNPGMPNAMQAITDLGHDQRYYVMVRGWLSYQLQGDMSILDANREQTRDEVRARINFLEKAIRAIDLE